MLCALGQLPGSRGVALAQVVADRVAAGSLAGARALTDRLLPVGDDAERAPGAGDGASPSARDRTLDFPAMARQAAREAGIRRPELFVRQIAAESGYDPCVRSPAGALGIAQIMPGTASDWQVDPFDPVAALTVAARHMAMYERRYGSYRLALAAYNAGPGAVRRYRGVPPYPETRGYIRLIYDTSVALRGTSSRFRIAGGPDPEFERRLARLQQAVRTRGGALRVTHGWRSYEHQQRLWRKARREHGLERARLWVAPPGCSNHNRGTAADVRGSLKLAHRLAPRFGLVFPMAREPWHVELRGIPTQSS